MYAPLQFVIFYKFILRKHLQVGHGYFKIVKVRDFSSNKACYQLTIIQSFGQT